MSSTSRIAALKDRSPRWLRDVADVTTRTYGVATAGLRPLPDFLVVGTKRGGTTTLWDHLVRHPQVLPMFPAPRGRKSSDFFFEADRHSSRWYRSHFHTHAYRRRRARTVGPVVTGEASPYYMYGPGIPARIAALAPATKLIVLLRDPVARAYGHHRERLKQGVETLPFEAALAAEEDRLAPALAELERDPGAYVPEHDFFSYRDRGIYLPQLQRIHAAFPREQVLILRAEDLYTDAQRVLDTTCRFLGITPQLVAERIHANHIPRAPIAPATERALRRFYAPHDRDLEAYLDRRFDWVGERALDDGTVAP